MNPASGNPPESRLAKVGTTVWLYLMAVVFAFCLSLVSSLFLLLVGTPIWLVSALTGFIGVFFSSYCAPRSSRWFCAMCLSVLGTGYYYFGFVKLSDGKAPDGSFVLPETSLLTLTFGACVAVLIHLLNRWLHNPKQPLSMFASTAETQN